jgi:hypothetical protein
MYKHAWLNPGRERSLVVDPGAWGYTTRGRRDEVDLGHHLAPRFWRICEDLVFEYCREPASLDIPLYVDFKLFDTSLECESQWQWLDDWLAHTEPRTLHIVNEQGNYSAYAHLFNSASAREPVHLDITVRSDSWDYGLVQEAVQLFAEWPRLSLVVNNVVEGHCRTYVIDHPEYSTGTVIERSY